LSWNPFPGIPNLLYLLLSPCFVLGFAGMVGDRMPDSQWRSAVLDVAGFGLAVPAFFEAFLRAQAAQPAGPSGAVATEGSVE
jgi:hypothetical protein